MPGAGERLAHAPDAAGLEGILAQLPRPADQVEQVEPLDRVQTARELRGAAGRAPEPRREPGVGDEQERGRLLAPAREKAGHLADERGARGKAPEDVWAARPGGSDRLHVAEGELLERRKRFPDVDLLPRQQEERPVRQRRGQLVAERRVEPRVDEKDGLGSFLRAETDRAFHARIITVRARASLSRRRHDAVKAP